RPIGGGTRPVLVSPPPRLSVILVAADRPGPPPSAPLAGQRECLYCINRVRCRILCSAPGRFPTTLSASAHQQLAIESGLAPGLLRVDPGRAYFLLLLAKVFPGFP